MKEHHIEDLIQIFAVCFLNDYNTILVRGDDEPIYLPSDELNPHHRIIFAHGFFASALHEISHWLIAGAKRRELIDFGYWYVPDGRNQEQQALFQVVEVKPQALEWILSKACGFKFRISCDNLDGDAGDPTAFKQAVLNQVHQYLELGLPERASTLAKALSVFYKTNPSFQKEDFRLEDL
jgi:hypothetical protein